MRARKERFEDKEAKERLRSHIETHGIITPDKRRAVLAKGVIARWNFDFRPLLLNSETLDDICALFWEHLKKEGDVQIGGLETTSIALTAGLLSKGRELDRSTTGFYIRKSRDKDGLQNHIEGNLTEQKIVLVDDTINSGQSLLRQVKLLESEGKKVHMILTIVRFREFTAYQYFIERGIKIVSLFTLDDFPSTGGVKKFKEQSPPPKLETGFHVEWKFQSSNPSYFHVEPKSTPVIDEKRIYFGSDNGSLWALDQTTGKVEWEWKLTPGIREPHIFSSPALLNGVLYFGAYDGNVYAVDAISGKTRWVYRDADRVGSSPCVSDTLSFVFIGLKFELPQKNGGLVALDATTGEKKWEYTFTSGAASSPAYSSKLNIVLIGTTAGEAYCLDAATGEQKWVYKTGGQILGSFAIDEERGYVSFGSFDHSIYILDIVTGTLVRRIESFEPVWSTPLLENGFLYIGLLDRRVLCANIDSGDILWTFWAKSRIFSQPILIEGKVYCGSNDGRLYVLDARTGKHLESFQATERIMNKVVYNPTSKSLFVTTYANEIYCLARINP